MRRVSTTLLALAALLVPVLSIAAHEDNDLGASGHGQEVVVTGHEAPEPAIHLEALSGTTELYCLGCALDKRPSSAAAAEGSVARPQTAGSQRRVEVASWRRLELPAYRSPRGPPVA